MASGGGGRGDRRRGEVALLLATSARLYGVLLLLYPKAFRQRYASEMVRDFKDLSREGLEEGGVTELARVWVAAFSDLALSALRERNTMLARNAYLPVEPGIVARWGALCALVGGSLGVAYHLVIYSLLEKIEGMPDPLTEFFIFSPFWCALSLSSLGLVGLYGAVVARSGRPGLLAGVGAVFSSTGSAVLWLATSGYIAVSVLASGSALFVPYTVTVTLMAILLWFLGFLLLGLAAFRQPLPVRLRVLPLALFLLIVSSYLLGGYYWVPFGMKPEVMLFWFLGFLLLGVATVRQPLPVRLRVLPLALYALIVPSYLLGWYFLTQVEPPVTPTIVMGFAQSLPFVGITLLGWVLLKGYDADEPLAVSGGSAQSIGAARGMARSASRTKDGAWWDMAWGACSATSGLKAAKEKELRPMLARNTYLTVPPWKRLLVSILITLTFVEAAVGFSLLQPTVYEASAKVVVGQKPGVPQDSDLQNNSRGGN